MLRLDEVIEPYDVKLGDPETKPVEMLTGNIIEYLDGNVMSLLPNDYHKYLEDAVKRAKAVANTEAGIEGLTLERVYEGTRGIGEQKGRLKKLREENPLQISEEAPGSVILPDDMEQIAVTALDDQAVYESLVNSFQDRAAYERDITRIENPEPG